MRHSPYCPEPLEFWQYSESPIRPDHACWHCGLGLSLSTDLPPIGSVTSMLLRAP